MTRQILWACLGEAYNYGCVMLKVPPAQADFIVEWGNLNIPEKILYTDEDGEMGRESETHVTVKYGLTVPGVPRALYKIAGDTQPFPVSFGPVSLFESPGYDVVKLSVESPGLVALNAKISQLPNEDKHPTYNPHCTVAYVQKGEANHLVGQNIFEADGAPANVFTASGMLYKGATPESGSDAERAQEEFLFSKVKSMPAAAMQAELARMEGRSPFDGMPFPSDARELIRFFRRKDGRSNGILS